MADEINTNKQLRIYDKTQKFIRVSVDEAIAREYNKWQGWQCSAGTRGLYIDFDGNMWICNTASTKLHRFDDDLWGKWREERGIEQSNVTMEHYSEFHKLKEAFKKPLTVTNKNKTEYFGFLGHIEKGYELPTSWVKCPWSGCGCGADVILSKSKSVLYKTMLSVTNSGWDGKGEDALLDQSSFEEPVAVEMNFPIPFQILWDLGRKCNYDCHYCWPSVHNRTDDHKDYELLIKTTNDLIDNWASGNSIRWNFGGGEPTLHPKFLDLLQHLKSKNQWTMVTSNGTRDHKYWAVAANNLNSINLSAHFDGLATEKDEDRFVRNIETICDNFATRNDDHWLEIKLMAPPVHFDRAVKLRDKILTMGKVSLIGGNGRINGAVSMVPIRGLIDAGNIVDYTKEQLEIFKNQ